jgi:hypothetical protein
MNERGSGYSRYWRLSIRHLLSSVGLESPETACRLWLSKLLLTVNISARVVVKSKGEFFARRLSSIVRKEELSDEMITSRCAPFHGWPFELENESLDVGHSNDNQITAGWAYQTIVPGRVRYRNDVVWMSIIWINKNTGLRLS